MCAAEMRLRYKENPMGPETERLIEEARKRKMSAEDIEKQRVSFAFGNASANDTGTIESVRAASSYQRDSSSAAKQ
jgi:hypothetical protein